MKTFIPLLLLSAVLFLSSCKKDQNATPKATGLAALLNPAATNYFVFVVGAYHNGVVVGSDTVVMQNTDLTDTILHYNGVSQAIFDIFNYDYVGAQYNSNNAACPYSYIALKFQETSNSQNDNTDCSLPDSLAQVGYPHMVSGDSDPNAGIYMWMANRNGTEAGSDRNTDTPVQILSVTDLPQKNGCKMVRVKAALTNVNFYNSICGPVPQFTISQGIMQMDLVNQ